MSQSTCCGAKLSPPLEDERIGDDTLRVIYLDVPELPAGNLPALDTASITAIDFRAFNVRLLASVMPDIVIAPLVGQGYDIVDLASHLSGCGYGGALWAVTPSVPNPAAVRNEVQAICDGIDFNLIVLEQQTDYGAAPEPAGPAAANQTGRSPAVNRLAFLR